MSTPDAQGALALRAAEAEVVRSREQMVAWGVALRGELRRSVEWRAWYRRAPMASLTITFGLGFLLGGWSIEADSHR
jgi:hypothetical protein